MISLFLYFAMEFLWIRHKFVVTIKNKYFFYALQFTWGILANIIGAIVMLCLLHKAKPQKYGRCIHMRLPVNWGLCIGMFIFGHPSVLEHEHGHAFQNAIYGPFFLTIVAIPSVVRFWIRNVVQKFGDPKNLSDYDSVWFEGQATKSGNKYFERG